MNTLARHAQSGLYSLGKLSRAPFASFMTCLIIGIALAMPAILFVALKNVEYLNGSIRQTLEMTVYLKQNTTVPAVNRVLNQLKKQSGIKQVRAVSPADGLKELQQQAGFDVTVEKWQDDPLPWAIVIQPGNDFMDPHALEQLRQQLQQLPDVDTVQLDMLWVKRLASFMTLLHRVMVALAVFLSVAVLLIVNNAIRSATEQHHEEIAVIKFIGGTHAFIRRPFLYVGLLYGLFGGMIAALLVTLMLFALKGPGQHLAELYGSHFTPLGLGAGHGLMLLAGSGGLGLIGSWLAVTRYLHRTR